MNSCLAPQALSYRDVKTYLLASVFVIGNIALPFVCHFAVDNGGLVLLPIYFFTLIAAYRYGLTMGILVAVASPIVNHLAFGMPIASVLPIILVKSSLLALCAVLAARYVRGLFVGILVAVVACQVFGSLFASSFAVAMNDLRVSLPGIALQIVGGYGVLRFLARNK